MGRREVAQLSQHIFTFTSWFKQLDAFSELLKCCFGVALLRSGSAKLGEYLASSMSVFDITEQRECFLQVVCRGIDVAVITMSFPEF
jgi:hypothetical protein